VIWRIALGALWGLGVLMAAAWWLVQRRRVDVWRSMPVPAVLVDDAGRVLARTGPGTPPVLPAGPLPPVGVVARLAAADGSPLAVTGVRGGALVLGLPADPVGESRRRLLAALAPRLAHEVATPLTAVRGHLDLVAHEPVGPVAARSLDIAIAEVDRLVGLARDLLTLTAVRAGANPATVEYAGALAEEAVTGLLPIADDLGATLTVRLCPEPVRVRVVAGDVIRAVRNLALNGLRHGRGERAQAGAQAGGRAGPEAGAGIVTVRHPVGEDRSVVRLEVADSGPGLDPAAIPGPDEPPPPGGGLGLLIVAEVLAAHGTSLHAGRIEGRPAVWFDLPAVPERPPGEPRP
jgi:signal transduction histidine kinase